MSALVAEHVPARITLESFLDACEFERWRATMSGRSEEGYGLGPQDALRDLMRQVINAVARDRVQAT